MEGERECLLMFSGGRDSWLSCCRLVEDGYKVLMVHFDNGKSVGSENVAATAKRVKEVYGNKVTYLGTVSIAGIWRQFFLPYMSMMPTEVRNEWGELPFSQFCCLTCRSAMYTWAIMKCLANGIGFLAEGARKSQNWPMMQPSMVERFKKLLEPYSIELLLPVFSVENNWERKNLLLMRNFIPKVLEPQCLLGVELPYGASPPKEVQEAVEAYFDSCVLGRARAIIENQRLAVVAHPAEIRALV